MSDDSQPMLKRTTWNLFSGAQLTFGPGAVKTLSGVILRRKSQRVLVISDRGLEEIGLVAHVLAAIKQTEAAVTLFLDGEVEPSTDTVAKVVDSAAEFRPDLFIALGGGSNMDLAKAAAAAFSHDCGVENLFGYGTVPGPMTPLVCLPTTAGTGSEVSHAAVIRNMSTSKKASILSQHIRPDVALVDPYLTLSCPAKVTAESGMDALTHAIEAYLVKNFYRFDDDPQHGLAFEGNHPLGDMYAEKAIRLIAQSLERAIEDPLDLSARSSMALAATLAGFAFASCGVSLVHALEYPIGAKYKCAHGIGNAIMLPGVMRFWMNERRGRIARIADMLGVPEANTMPPAEAAEAAVASIEELRRSIGLPTCLAEVGGKVEDIDELAANAVSAQRLLNLSPVETTVEDVRLILKAAL